MTEQKFKEKICDTFRGLAPSACNHCGADLQEAVTAIENIFTDHVLALIEEAGYVQLADDQTFPNMAFFCPDCRKVQTNTRCNITGEVKHGQSWRKVKLEEKDAL